MDLFNLFLIWDCFTACVDFTNIDKELIRCPLLWIQNQDNKDEEDYGYVKKLEIVKYFILIYKIESKKIFYTVICKLADGKFAENSGS